MDQRLTTSSPTLDQRVFRVVEVSPNSAISSETLFRFVETDAWVAADYAGGCIACGRLVGRRLSDDKLTVGYAQVHTDGIVRTGTSEWQINLDRDGRVRLVESYKWDDGTTGENILEAAS